MTAIPSPRKQPPRPAGRDHLLSLLGVFTALVVLFAPRAVLAIQTVAVLDLDGYDVSYETAQVMSQGLRDGFLEEATFDPLSGYDITEGLSSGQGENIRRARELLADARQKMDSGNTSAALHQLAEVLSLHDTGWSWVGRRPELADAHFFTAMALVKLGRTTEATDHLIECLYLYPGYDSERAVKPSSAMSSLFSRAKVQLVEVERRTVPGSRMATIGDRLDARYVVSGYVVGDGTVHVALYQEGRLITETTDYADELPLYPGDTFFYDMAVLLVGGEHRSSAGSASMPIGTPSDTEPDFGDFHDIPSVDTPTVTSTSSIGTSDGGHLTDQGSSYHNDSRARRRRGEHSMSGIRYERKPVTETWWFWTGVTVAVAGGGVGLYFLLREDGVSSQTTEEQDSYTITLDPSGVEAQ